MYRHPPHYRAAGAGDAVSDALIARLQKVVVGDPAQEGVKMGALVNHEQRQDVQENVNRLIAAGCECCWAAGRFQRRRRLPADAAVLPAAG
jgi:acyl-CoA reductase-like NAD-dependent aldehyde dehydrogenase